MESVITDFNENGFSILHGILASETLEAVKHECKTLVDALASQRQTEGKLANTYPDADLKSA